MNGESTMRKIFVLVLLVITCFFNSDITYSQNYGKNNNSDTINKIDDSVVENLKQILKDNPGVDQSYLNLIDYYSRYGYYSEAISYMKQLIDKKPDNYLYHLKLGYLFVNNKDLDSALAEYNEVLRLKPDCSKAYIAIADVHFKTKNTDEAIANCQKAIQLDKSGNNYIYVTVGNVYLDNGFYKRALSYFIKYKGLEPKRDRKVDSYIKKTRLLMAQNPDAEPLTEEQSLNNIKEEAMHYFKRGKVFLRSGNNLEALNSFKTAKQLDPSLTEQINAEIDKIQN